MDSKGSAFAWSCSNSTGTAFFATISARPSRGSSLPMISRSNVDFPAPLAPMTATRSPRSMQWSMSLKRVEPP